MDYTKSNIIVLTFKIPFYTQAPSLLLLLKRNNGSPHTHALISQAERVKLGVHHLAVLVLIKEDHSKRKKRPHPAKEPCVKGISRNNSFKQRHTMDCL